MTVCPPWWDEVWIVACGPSAREFDLDRLAGKTVVTVNDAYYRFSARQLRATESLTLFSADPDWVRTNLFLWRNWRGERYVCLALDTNPDLADIPGVTYLDRAHHSGLSDDPRKLCTGGNSGYAAINLAVLKRATEIHLVGFDMDPATNDKFRLWLPRFRTMLPVLEYLGVRVLNHNPASFIDAFEKEE